MSYNYAFFFAGLIPQTFLSRDAKNQNAKNDVCQHIYIYVCIIMIGLVGRLVAPTLNCRLCAQVGIEVGLWDWVGRGIL